MNSLDSSWGESAVISAHFERHKQSVDITDFAEQFAERLNEMKIHPVLAQNPEFREMLSTSLHEGSIMCVRNMDGRQSTAILTQENNQDE